MCHSNFIIDASLFLKERISLDGAEYDIGYFCGIEICFIEQSMIELSFEAEQWIFQNDCGFAIGVE